MRRPNPETRDRKSEIRTPKSETQNPKSETRTPNPGNQSPELRNPRTQNPKSESRNPKPETRMQVRRAVVLHRDVNSSNVLLNPSGAPLSYLKVANSVVNSDVVGKFDAW